MLLQQYKFNIINLFFSDRKKLIWFIFSILLACVSFFFFFDEIFSDEVLKSKIFDLLNLKNNDQKFEPKRFWTNFNDFHDLFRKFSLQYGDDGNFIFIYDFYDFIFKYDVIEIADSIVNYYIIYVLDEKKELFFVVDLLQLKNNKFMFIGHMDVEGLYRGNINEIITEFDSSKSNTLEKITDFNKSGRTLLVVKDLLIKIKSLENNENNNMDNGE